MKNSRTVKRVCLGSGRLPKIFTRDDLPDINPGDVIHGCPVCGKRWGRNTLNDWSALPTPRHMVDIEPAAVPVPGAGVVPARYFSQRIESWDDERSSGNGIIVTLKYGFTFEPGEHYGVKGFDSGKEAAENVAGSGHCYCDDCEKNLPKIVDGKEIYHG